MSSVLNLALAAALAPLALTPGAVVDPVRCGPQGEYGYALYLPAAFDAGHAWPILYVFDPRARGRFALELFRPTAERLGFVVASSNDTRSDTDDGRPNLRAIQAMWEDTHARLPLAPGRALAAGFSGGARLATLLGQATRGGLSGVLAAGAGFSEPDQIPKDTPFVVFASAGRFDFNYYELRALDEQLERLGVVHALEVFDGAHAWAPPEVLERGFEWLELQAIRRGLRPRDEALVQAFERRGLERARALERDGRLLEAADAYALVAGAMAGLRPTEAGAAAQRLIARPDVTKERARRRSLDQRERAWIAERYGVLERLLPESATSGRPDAARPPLLPELLRDLDVLRLLRDAQAEKDAYTRDAMRRRMASLSVQTAFYLPRRLTAKGEFARAALSLGVAVALQPTAPAPRYDLACALARGGRRKEALVELERAVANGFQDAAHMAADEDLKSLRDAPEFRALLERARTPAPAASPGGPS